MFGFEWWWALVLLPLPWLTRTWLRPAEGSQTAISVPLLNRYGIDADAGRNSASIAAAIALWIFWLALVIAASRPFWLGEPVARSQSGRDLMLALDISGSMSESDMTVDGRGATRIDVLKIVVESFIERRHGDRLGLILFGSQAYNYVPLTFDLDTLKLLMLDISSGLAGRHTAIGDAIGIAIKAMQEEGAEQRVLILVTDGSNTAGFDNPVLAAAIAAQRGLTIHTIGVGSTSEALSRTYGAQNVPTGIALNEPVLRQISALTGGRYFRATSAERLEQIYQELDRLEPIEHDYETHRPRGELFVWPLCLAMIAMLALVVATIVQSRRSLRP